MTSDPASPPREPEQSPAEENSRTLIAPGLNTSTSGSGQPTSTSAPAALKNRLGRYEIRQFLGSGGMGVVCLGHDTVIERNVAIKILPDAIANDPGIKARFVAEARAAGKLTHPHTVGIYEIGEDNGTNYLVMEFVDGGNLADEISKRGALPVLEATRLMADATRGVAAAHAAGLIHRDIKPANLLRSVDGVVKVADFGLAKGGIHDLQLTQAGRVVGTPYYMSPEQCQSRPVDARSDVYSLGATYFSLLTGQSPYQSAGSSMQVMYAHCHSPPPNPRSINPSLPEACSAIVQRATAKLPEDRYQSAEELLADLEAVIATLSGAGQILLPSGTGSRLSLPATPIASPARRPHRLVADGDGLRHAVGWWILAASPAGRQRRHGSERSRELKRRRRGPDRSAVKGGGAAFAERDHGDERIPGRRRRATGNQRDQRRRWPAGSAGGGGCGRRTVG